MLFEPLQLLLALLVLGGEGVGPGLGGGGVLPGIALQGGSFLLQTGLALLQPADALAAVLQLLLFQGELAAEAGSFVVPSLLLFGGLLLGSLELGQLLFEGGGFGGEQFELHLLLFGGLFGLGVLLLQLGVFAVDFLDGGLGGGLFAFEALALALPRADLLFEAGGLLAQQGVLLVEPVLLSLLLLLGLAQHLHGIVHGLVLPGEFVLPLAGAFVFGGGAVGGGEGVPPLGEVVAVLRLVELGGEAAVAFGGSGLALEFFHLAAKFGLQIAKALEVFAGVAQAVFGFAAAFFIFGYAGGFFDVGAQFFGAGFDDAGNHALFDHGVAARADAGAEEKVGDVAAAHLLAVDVVAGFTLAGELAADADFAVLPPCALQAAVGIAEHELHGGAGGGAAGGGAVENHVLHALAAQLFGRGFAQHPAHGVDNVGFAAAVGPDYGHQLAGHVDGGGVGERFEAGKFDVGEAHEKQ